MFLDSYGEQSCTAGRSSFITGQSVYRTGLSKVGFPGAPVGMSDKLLTIAAALKNQGYATGQFGKNHLGDLNSMLPTNHGFDEFFGNLYHLNAEEEPEMKDYFPAKDFPKIKDAIFTNVTAGWIVFHIDEKDVPNFKLKTQPIDAEELASLPPYTAFIKVGTDDPGIMKTPPPVPTQGKSCADYIRKHTLECFGAPREPVSKADTAAHRNGFAGVGSRRTPPRNGHAGTHSPTERKNGDSEFFE